MGFLWIPAKPYEPYLWGLTAAEAKQGKEMSKRLPTTLSSLFGQWQLIDLLSVLFCALLSYLS